MNGAGRISPPRDRKQGQRRVIATEKGRALLGTPPEKIALLMREPEFREFYRNEASTAGTDSGIKEPVHNIAASTTPEEKIDAAYASLTGDLRDELLERILENRPAFFEQLIVDLLVTMGYGGNHKNAAAQFGRSGDGSVDAIINVERFGLDRICVQAKRYAPANQVGRPNVNGFVGRLVGLGASKGVLSLRRPSASRRNFQ